MGSMGLGGEVWVELGVKGCLFVCVERWVGR